MRRGAGLATLRILATWAIGACVLAGCMRGGDAARRQAQLESLVVAVYADPASLDPGANTAEPVGSEIILNVFDTLVAWKAPAFDRLEGRLATGWAVSPDGKVFTLRLRDGVRFHDGTRFDAAAVKFSIERTRARNPYMKASFGPIADVAVLEPLQVRITLTQSMPMFLSLLAQPQAAIVSPAAVARAERAGARFGAHPVGTGAFRFRSYSPDTSVVLERNPDYFRGPSKLARVVYRVIPDASTRRLELKYGGIDISQQTGQLSSIPVEDIASFRQDGKVEVIEVPSQIIRQLEFNNNRKDSPVHDLRVRQAMAHAVDYEGLIKGVFGGLADRVYGPLPSTSWAFDPAMRDQALRYDPARARALLAQAGYGKERLRFTLYTYQGSIWNSVATFLQANFADVGIDVTVQQTEFPQLRALHTSGRFEIMLEGRQPWYNDPDAHVTIGYLSSLANTAMTFRMPPDAARDRLILEAQGAVDPGQRKRLYHRLQATLARDVPAVYLFSNKLILFKRANVHGLALGSAPPLNEYWAVYKSRAAP